MTLTVFISYSGSTGRSIANLIKGAIEEIFNYDGRVQVKCFVNDDEIEHGKQWYGELQNWLDKSSVGVFILDHAHSHSLWMPYELRSFEKKDDAIILPFVFGVLEKDIKGPFQLVEIKKFKSHTFRNALEQFRKFNIDFGNHFPENFQNKWNSLQNDINNILKVSSNQKESLQHYIAESKKHLLNLAKEKYTLSKGWINKLESVLWSIENEEIFDAISNIAKSTQQCIDKSLNKSTRWDDVWAEYAKSFLLDASQTILNISQNYEIEISNVDDARWFWRNRIMKLTDDNLWTTNVPGTFGRSPAKDLLKVQQDAIENREIKITRLFIYNTENEKDLLDLKEILLQQLSAKINVYIISQKQFDWDDTNLTRRIGQDFMIIDNKYIYVTNTNSRQVTSIKFIQDQRVLRNANELQERLMANAEEVVLDSDGKIDFPAKW